MKNILLALLFLTFSVSSFAVNYTWNGSVSSDWNDGDNWTGDGGFPDDNSDDAVINTAATTHSCILDANRDLDQLTVSAGALDLNGFRIDADNSMSFTGGTISNGELRANSFSQISGTTFSGTMVLVKTGGGNNQLSGGNTFNGPTTIINQDNNRLRLSNTTGDTYNNTLSVQNTSTSFIELSYSGASTFAENVTISNTNASGSIHIGNNGGTSVLAAGKSLIISSYAVGSSFTCNGLTSPGTAACGTVNVTGDINFESTSINGDITASSTGNSAAINITSSKFTAGADFTADDIVLNNSNSFSTASGSSSFTKTSGGGNNNWTGGNTFGPVTVTNEDNNRIRMANTVGDTFTGTATFINSSSSQLDVSFTGANSFADDVTISNTNASGIVRFGQSGGTSVLAAGKSLISASYTVGSGFICNNLTSPGTADFGEVNVTGRITFNSTSINGDITATTTGSNQQITISSSSFTANASFTADRIVLNNTNAFSTVSGSCSFTKTPGGADDTWTGGNTFGAFTIDNQDATRRIRMANVAGDTFMGNATFNTAATTELQACFNGTNVFYGNISTIGSSDAITFCNGNGVCKIAGNGGNQNLQGGSSNPPSFERLEMASTGNGTLTLQVPVLISEGLTLTSGIINTSFTNTLTLTDETTSTSIGSSSSFVNGPMDYIVSSGNSALKTLNFPIGKDAEWRPAVLQVAHNTNTEYTYRGEVFNQSAVDLGWTLPATVDTVSSFRYWDIDRFLTSTMASSSSADLRNGGSGPVITFYFDTNDFVYDGDDLTICKNTEASPSTWFDIGGTGAPSYSAGDLLSGSVTSTSNPTSFNSFSTFTLGNLSGGINPLPIELVSFDAYKTVEESFVQIEWATSSEINNDYFTVEKSSDGINWETVSIITGAGNSNSVLNYAAKDYDPYPNTSFYRLKQTDFDGTFEYSELVAINISGTHEEVVVYPNPVAKKLNIQSSSIQQIKIIDSEGVTHIDAETSDFIDVSNLPNGVYFLQMVNTETNEVIIRKLIIFKE
jgi:hypothetical protein